MIKIITLALIGLQEMSAIEGEWKLQFRTVGKRVEWTFRMQVDQTDTAAWCQGKEVQLSYTEGMWHWKLEVQALLGSKVAEFYGNLNGVDKMSGILLIPPDPHESKAVKWKAIRRESSLQ